MKFTFSNSSRKKVEGLEQEVIDLKTKKIIDETQFPVNMLEQNGLIPHKPMKLKRGRGYRPIFRSEIEEAKTHSPFATRQAKWLGVHPRTYRKYCRMYNIWDPHPNEKGKRNLFNPERGKYPIAKILAGDFNGNPLVSNFMVIDKIIRSKTFPARCNICGYNKRRIIDRKMALLLDHKDGDQTNFKLDNLQILCYNCTFECGRGYIRRGNHMYTFDPEIIDGIRLEDVKKQSRY